MSSDGSFENLSNVEMDSREPVAQDAPNQNQMILKEIEAIRHLIENKPAGDLTETHLALITKFSVLAMEHEQLKKSSSKTISEYKAIIEMLSGRLEKLEARQDSVAMQLNCASENIQNLNAKIKGFEPEKAVGTSESASENFPAAPTTSATSQPMVHPQIVEINKRLKAARTSQEREAVFADMKKNPILFHAWMRQPKD